MSTQDNGGPAFPQVQSEQRGSNGDYWTETFSAGGMTLRDYFAAKAMQAAYENIVEIAAEAEQRRQDPCAVLAQVAYEIADAMLKARQQ